MKLFIDTSDAEKMVVGLDGERFETEAMAEKSQKLLPFIDKVLEEKGKTIKDVSEIEVNCGPGSYTGLRVGMSVANVLGWGLGVKVNGRDITKEGPLEPEYT